MTGRIDVIAPATITVVNGGTVVSSLQALPPYGITVTDPAGGDTLSLTVIAATGAVLSASSAGGASVVAQGNTLSLAGTAAQVNAALASLQLDEPADVVTDQLRLTAADPAVLSFSTDIAVQITPAEPPAFVSPPATLAVAANSLSTLSGLLLADPDAAGLAAGQGQSETLQLSLSVGAGILLLPGLLPTSGISAMGLGTGSVSLVFTADRLNAVNAILAGLAYAGPGQTALRYAMTNLTGPLGSASTGGTVTLQAGASLGIGLTLSLGGETLILGNGSLSGGLEIPGIEVVTGNLSGDVFIGAAGSLELPSGLLSLSGTSDDFGTAGAATLSVTGTAILAIGADIAGEISVGPAGLIDFGGTLIAGAAQTGDQPVLTLADGVLTGSGTLFAGNTGDTGMISGPGTLLAAGGDTLLVAAASISGGANLDIAGGGVLELGAQATVDGSVRLAFAPGYGTAPITGALADSLSEDGGVIVIADPLSFNGSIAGFAPGDRLVFPGLTGLSLSDITGQSFVVSGLNSASQREQFTLHASIPAGTTLAPGLDAGGDGQIGLRGGQPELFVGGSSFSATQIDASAGVNQALPGLQLLLPGWTSQSLTLTLSVGQGVLSEGGERAAALTLTAANPAALNSLLAGVVYTANLSAGGDTLVASSNTGPLAGLNSQVPIVIEAGGTVSGFAPAPTDAQTVLFAGATANSVLVTQAAAPGAVIVSGAADFADALAVGGIGGTALSIDGGGIGIFDAGSAVSLAGDAEIGDSGGAGTLGIVTSDFSIGSAGAPANLVVGGNLLAGGSAAEITGAANVSGNVLLGQLAAARLDVSGGLSAASTTIGSAGSLIASGNASPSLGALVDSGTLVLENAAQASAQQLLLAGQLTLGSRTRLSGLASAVIANGGALMVGADAVLSASVLNAVGGGILDQGSIAVAGDFLANDRVTLAGGLLQAGIATLGNGAVLSGSGDLVATGIGAKLALTGGEILASGGLLSLDGNVTMSGGGNIGIAGSAALDLIHAASGGGIGFDGPDAKLTINDLAVESSPVTGMLASDVIDLVGVAPSLVSYSNGTISAKDNSGNALGSFALGIDLLQPAVTLVSDGNGGALITLGGQLACFAGGTRLLTPNGYVPVETLRPGDPVITRLGVRRAVRWIGLRHVEIDLQARQDARPVVILAGAMGLGQPSRPVRLSPAHAVFIDNALVPAMHLVNGATIRREPWRGQLTYFHIELDRHDLLMAEGLPVESYLDTGNRGEFQRELGIRGNARKACAPVLTGGPKLARIRRFLHEVTLRSGFALTQDPMLRATAGDRLLKPEIRRKGAMQIASFQFSAKADHVLLQANSAAPAETDPDSEDRRELALCLRQPHAKRQRLHLGAGWHVKAPGDSGRWMSGSGEIFLREPAAELTLRLAAVAQTWRPVDLAEPRD